ncbi:hypothetical protein Misp01_25670 [Microtetraspora sp. NBRC 13810]|nr:hypothetical protein Misp01_25670 [Microtetraspora sp. NBRC 13810]
MLKPLNRYRYPAHPYRPRLLGTPPGDGPYRHTTRDNRGAGRLCPQDTTGTPSDQAANPDIPRPGRSRNITKCCTEHIKITDNALIPMKKRVVDRRYDPLVWLGNKIFKRSDSKTR